MEQLMTPPARLSLCGSRLTQVARKPARRSRRRKEWTAGFGRIVPMPHAFAKRRAPRAAVSAGSDPAVSGAREQEWVRSHGREYSGRWVALDGSRLVAEATGAREALEQARAAGVVSPFLVHMTEPSELPFGGW
jgi:hypothetical protein